MKDLKNQARWARREVAGWWTVALTTPVKPELLLWLTSACQVKGMKVLNPCTPS